jgi:hypothetical protein
MIPKFGLGMVIFPCLVQSMDGQTIANYLSGETSEIDGNLSEATRRSCQLEGKGEVSNPKMFRLSFIVPLKHGDSDAIIPKVYTPVNKSRVKQGHQSTWRSPLSIKGKPKPLRPIQNPYTQPVA